MLGDKEFRLDNMSGLWEQFKEYKRTLKEAKNWVDEFTQAVKTLAGDAQKLNIGKQQVGAIELGQLNRSLLAAEQPDIIKKFTREVTRETFDEEWFRREMPDLHDQYRARRLVLKGESAKADK